MYVVVHYGIEVNVMKYSWGSLTLLLRSHYVIVITLLHRAPYFIVIFSVFHYNLECSLITHNKNLYCTLCYE